jgi:hypothetical protein
VVEAAGILLVVMVDLVVVLEDRIVHILGELEQLIKVLTEGLLVAVLVEVVEALVQSELLLLVMEEMAEMA